MARERRGCESVAPACAGVYPRLRGMLPFPFAPAEAGGQGWIPTFVGMNGEKAGTSGRLAQAAGAVPPAARVTPS
jgi:hypothetical protein